MKPQHMVAGPIVKGLFVDFNEQARLARIERHRAMAALPNLQVAAPVIRVNRKTRRQARNADNAANVVAQRGFNRAPNPHGRRATIANLAVSRLVCRSSQCIHHLNMYSLTYFYPTDHLVRSMAQELQLPIRVNPANDLWRTFSVIFDTEGDLWRFVIWLRNFTSNHICNH